MAKKNDIAALVQARRKKYGNLDEYRTAMGELAEAAQLNMSVGWKEITNDIWWNGQNCTCQTRDVMCPCVAGVQAAKEGGECFCGLFFGHDHQDE